ncbi:hypothetical protein AYK24_10520 [Thermoplasmatales archaeon SG8-52-4]|nr:MAG: hypothetical protein AYK24_10520 [Thermoplasmatales archaeon SG8-52-4]
MKRVIICIFILMLLVSTYAGALPFNSTLKKFSKNNTTLAETSYTHNVLGEYGTMTTCVPCKYAHRALKYLYQNKTVWDLPFYYITYVYDKNNWSYQRVKNELGLQASPTVFWDGGWKKDTGGTNVETEMTRYNASIRSAASRTVKDIDLSLNVEWLGAVNEVPSNGATGVPVEKIMRWNNSEFKIDVEVFCNEAGSYNGHLHVQVTEVESEWYNDKFGDPETFEFKDYAYNGDVSFSGGGTWSKTIFWDGCTHHNKDNPPRYYSHIKQDNIMVIAAIFNKNNNNYVDEVVGFLAGEGTDPKLYDVYFGKTNPPPKLFSNISATKYNNITLLEFDTTYYWKIDTWNANGVKTTGELWTFKTRGNSPPNEPNPIYPQNGSTGIPINTNLSWTGGDPDFDLVTYDLYFGEGLGNPPKVASKIDKTTYNPPGNLNFNKPYSWKIVAWDVYGYKTVGDLWTFKTQVNLPPNAPSNPNPANGANNVNVETDLVWTGGDPNPGDPVTYDVYFGVTNPPTKKSSNQTTTSYDPGTMITFKKYYWYIVSWDKQGETVTGPIWSFTTGLQEPPTAPEINGPINLIENTEYEFTFVSNDPNNDDIKYYISWGDGKNEWTDYYKSGEIVKVNHTWTKQGKYTINANGRDLFNLDGPQGELKVNVPRNKAIYNSLLLWLLERFPLLNRLLLLIK